MILKTATFDKYLLMLLKAGIKMYNLHRKGFYIFIPLTRYNEQTRF
jgi:hypothetical protein